MRARFGSSFLPAATAGAALLLAGCGSDVPPPDAAFDLTGAAIVQAEQAGAAQVSPVELRQAQALLGAARTASAEGDYSLARRLADEAAADARLAEVRTRAVVAEQQLRAAAATPTVLAPAPNPAPTQ